MNNLKEYICPNCGKKVIIIKPVESKEVIRKMDLASREYNNAEQALTMLFSGELTIPKEKIYEITRAILDLKSESTYMMGQIIEIFGEESGIPKKEGYNLAIDQLNWVYHEK